MMCRVSLKDCLCLGTPTVAHLAVHLFTADKGDDDGIGDGVTQYQHLPQEREA